MQQIVPQEDDKNCHSTWCFKKKNAVKEGSMCPEKNCQENQNIHMWPVKPAMKTNHVW